MPTLEHFRRFLGSNEAQRARRAGTFFNHGVAVRRRLGQGLHDRGEASVFAVGSLSDEDRQGLAEHLPLHVRTISVAHKVIPAGTVWDVSVRGERWGLDDLEELYVVVNVGTLVIEPGASLVIRGNVFVLICQHLICQAEPGGGPDYHIGILPTPFSVDLRSGPMDGADGAEGADGQDGADGRRLHIEESYLGARIKTREDPQVMNGGRGAPGARGERGGRGRTGGMCKLAEISIRQLTGPLTIFAQAGRGGDGGDGGDGGRGGEGGDAVKGQQLWMDQLPDGISGDGGDGGDGGRGGAAGGGGIASNIYVTVPLEAEPRVSRIARPSQPGSPGRGGDGGTPGRGGRLGGEARTGHDGRPGEPGARGHLARSRPAPWIFLNERPPAYAADNGRPTRGKRTRRNE